VGSGEAGKSKAKNKSRSLPVGRQASHAAVRDDRLREGAEGRSRSLPSGRQAPGRAVNRILRRFGDVYGEFDGQFLGRINGGAVHGLEIQGAVDCIDARSGVLFGDEDCLDDEGFRVNAQLICRIEAKGSQHAGRILDLGDDQVCGKREAQFSGNEFRRIRLVGIYGVAGQNTKRKFEGQVITGTHGDGARGFKCDIDSLRRGNSVGAQARTEKGQDHRSEKHSSHLAAPI
jgi:hypothetical protein